jgi:hypothetical protein
VSTDYGIPITPPQPAMTYEDMWFQVKEYLAGMVMDKKTPQAVFNVRELMGELERERVRPLEQYVRLRKVIDNGTPPRTTSRRARLTARRASNSPVLGLVTETEGAIDG